MPKEEDDEAYECPGSPLIMTSPSDAPYLCEVLTQWSTECQPDGGVCCSGTVEFAAPGAYYMEGTDIEATVSIV